MKAWALGVLLVAAVLSEKALARPGEADDDEEGFQDDEANQGSSQPPSAPVLRSNALRLTPKPGDTIVLPCDVENAPTVVWLNTRLNNTATLAIGDRRLTNKDDKRLTFFANHTLELKDVQPTDSGTWTCRVTQGLEVVHHLNVYEPPRLVAAEPSDKQVVLQRGEHLNLRCNVTGFPEPTVVWTRKGKDLPGGRRDHTGEHLHFAHVGVKHIGTYTCTATNLLGKVQHSFDVVVSDGPEIVLGKDMTNTDVGQTAELTCVVHAYPTATLEWYFADKMLSPSQRVQIRHEAPSHGLLGVRHVLRIVDVSEADLGSYHCLAKNEKGTARRTLKLFGVPTPARLDEVSQGGNGGPVLYWTVESLAPITKYELMYRRKDSSTNWTIVELPVGFSEGNIYKVEYELKDVEAAEYEAKMKSKNSYGWSDLSPKYPFTTDAFKQSASVRVGEAGSGAPVDRICSSLLLSAVIVLLARS